MNESGFILNSKMTSDYILSATLSIYDWRLCWFLFTIGALFITVKLKGTSIVSST